MIHPTTKTADIARPPLGDLSTRYLAHWMATVALNGRCPAGPQDVVVQRGAELGDIRAELRRREMLGVGVR